jgi:hypothetical protein
MIITKEQLKKIIREAMEPIFNKSVDQQMIERL